MTRHGKPLFIASFVKRYWKLLVFLVALELLRHVEQVVYLVGPLFFLVELTVASIACALLLRNLFMRDTLDHYAQHNITVHDGEQPSERVSQFHLDWNELPPTTKVKLALFVLVALFLGACLVASSLAK